MTFSTYPYYARERKLHFMVFHEHDFIILNLNENCSSNSSIPYIIVRVFRFRKKAST